MEKTNAQRIKNILDGDITGATKTIVGYKKKHIDHIEGDIWEEDEKQWTIKNGIKQNITKLDEIRSLINLPLHCPKCGKLMRKRLDKKFWQLKEQCFDCTINEDTNRIIKDEFKEYSKQVIENNANSFMQDLKAQVKSFIESVGAKHFITEMGDIEEWIGGKSKEELQVIMNKKIDAIEQMKTDSLD